MRSIIAALCLLAALPAAAQVNKCIVAGRVVYQAAPCKPGTQQAVIQPRSDVSEAAAQANREKFLADDKVRQTNNRRDRLDAEIAARETDISDYQKAMDGELAALQTRKARANNNLAGATWEQSLATEMQAVTAKYKAKIETAQERIKTLRAERERLGAP